MKIYKYSLLIIITTLMLFKVESAKSTPNYSKDIAPIIYNKCTNCHRAGEIAPMPFTNFNEVKNYGQMIKFVTSSKFMPPWSPNSNYSNFLGERVLSQSEIDMIKDWVDGGMPQGNMEDEPNLPIFPEGSQLGKPDLVLKMSEKFLHKGNNQDQYQVFVLPVNLEENKKIKAIEFRPDNKKIVHHAILGIDTTSIALELDADDPRYGYEQFGGFGFEPLENTWAGWAPGSFARFYPADIGKNLYKNSVILAQIHYAPVTNDEYDQSEINIFYDKENQIKRNLLTTAITPENLFEEFKIPANKVKSFTGVLNVPIDISLVSVLPHMHLTGQLWEIFAITPNKDTINIIKIDKWDFNWQDFYYSNKLKKIPAKSKVYAKATYDNRAENPNNPNQPPKDIYWGEGTSDEMYICYFNYVPYNFGDENLDLTTGVEQNLVYSNQIISDNIFPNPTIDYLNIKLNENVEIKEVMLELYSQFGQIINDNFSFEIDNENKLLELNCKNLTSGIYYTKIKIRGQEKYLRFIKI